MKIYTYEVLATGLGSGYNTYPMQFEFTSLYDIEEDSDEVYNKLFNEIKRKGFKRTECKIHSIDLIRVEE